MSTPTYWGLWTRRFTIADSPDTVRAADVAFVRHERIPAVELTEKFWPGPPDLPVEVISPTHTLYELDEKIGEYLASGVTPLGRESQEAHCNGLSTQSQLGSA